MKLQRIENSQKSFKGNSLHPIDLHYKKLLQKGLKNTYNIDCEIKDLKSIAGPIELKNIIKNLMPNHYEVGDNFRANFHIHTNASDGSFSAKEFLKSCVEHANSIFKNQKTKDNLPPFTAAITDHDRITNVKKVIAIIAQNPNKYKNFKFVTGCEFLFDGYKEPHSMFEAVGLGFNPFAKYLEPMMQGFSSNNIVKDIKKVKKAGGILSWAHPIITPDKIQDDEFFKFLKENGINGVEGNYQYKHWNKDYIKELKPLVDAQIKKFKMFVTGGTDSHKKTIY